METLSVNTIISPQVNSDECSYSENMDSESVDPLRELNNETPEPQYYRMDSIVFAEPLSNMSNKNHTKDLNKETNNEEEFIFKDSFTVQKRPDKKYKKYHISIEDTSDLKCPQTNCTSTFTTTKLLKAHIRKVHCADREYICEQCGAGFCARYLLARHTAVHTGTRVTCHVCSKSLSGRTNLSTHLRSHSGVRAHSCDVCSKSFTRASTLAAHVKFVHREGLLGCDQCDKSARAISQAGSERGAHTYFVSPPSGRHVAAAAAPLPALAAPTRQFHAGIETRIPLACTERPHLTSARDTN
ncbi:unnamed protein product [Chrysodeixis includens]|uniref:C2H2-type domain-containing protein n=1 Tax=Chrysodeixis includens TaxID=689277 RepID=A0A9N8L0J0_CHRIL|nr:unnamed protein product [Chrysodeixis includens]